MYANIWWKVYLKNRILLLENDNAKAHILKNRIWSLFQPKLRNHADSIKHRFD